MGLSPVVLYNAVLSDVCCHLPSGYSKPAVDDAPDASYHTVASSALLRSLLKKWTYENTTEADNCAAEKFLSTNKSCQDWTLRLESWKDELLFGNFLKEIDNFLHPSGGLLFSSYFYLLEAGRTGPGSSLGANGQSMYAKLFSSKLTCTSELLYEMYSAYVRLYPEFADAENIRYANYGGAAYVNSSRSSFVPKSEDISRMICTEPSLNMFIQLGLGKLLEERLRESFNLDLAQQPFLNQQLAQEGSLNGRYSTIDLSSASDSISLSLCRTIFPAWFNETLLELRSPNTILGNTLVPLHMVSTMGNGFTFPLQTLIFSCLIRAVYRTHHIDVADRGSRNWGCFGDDLVVDKLAYHSTVRLLNILGFKLNNAKSFFEGHFRESCGADWFLGQSVRGVYIRKLTSPQDISVAINLLNEWSSITGIALNCAVNYLMTGLRNPCYVPFDENNDAGVRIPSFYHPKLRYDRNGSFIYKAYRSVPKVIRIGDGTIHVPRGHRSLIYNPHGLMMSFLRGEVKSGLITVRHDRTMYRAKRRVSPNWDYLPTAVLRNGCKIVWQRWETAVLSNLG